MAHRNPWSSVFFEILINRKRSLFHSTLNTQNFYKQRHHPMWYDLHVDINYNKKPAWRSLGKRWHLVKKKIKGRPEQGFWDHWSRRNLYCGLFPLYPSGCGSWYILANSLLSDISFPNIFFTVCGLSHSFELQSFCKSSLSSWGTSPLFVVCRVFLSWVNVDFCQMLFLHLLIWSYDFSSLAWWYDGLH